MPEKKSHWSPDGSIFFLDGWGWRVAPDGRTVCINTEEEILKKWSEERDGTGSQTNQGEPGTA